MVSDKHISMRIRDLRKESGMSVDEFGRQVDRSGKTISAWEAGINMPSAEMLITICRKFGVSIEYFYPRDIQNDGASVESKDERMVIELWRKMDESQKERLLAEMRDYAIANEAKKEGSGRAVHAAAVDAVKK